MAKLSLEDLRKLREEKKAEFNKREEDGVETRVIIGMGTCGIAAGAKQTWEAFTSGIKDNKLKNCSVKQTGCMGLCHSEPTVEVIVPGMPPVIYGMVDPELTKSIIAKHIIGRELLDESILERPAADILTIIRGE
ncbi:(2Fe-2S) ferredoxin domain-containing protein [Treponema sp. R80B11-R83G3]